MSDNAATLHLLICLTAIVALLALVAFVLAVAYLQKARRIFNDYQRGLARFTDEQNRHTRERL